jgi:hypothetical protein
MDGRQNFVTRIRCRARLDKINTQNYWFLDFDHCPAFYKLQTQHFGNWISLPSQALISGQVIEVSCFQGTQNSRCLLFHVRTGTHPISETLCSLVPELRTKSKNPVTQSVKTPLSELSRTKISAI